MTSFPVADTTLGPPPGDPRSTCPPASKALLRRVLGVIQRLRELFTRPMHLPSIGLSLLSMPTAEAPPAGAPDASGAPAPLDPALRQQMREELSRLLNHVPSARRALPALGVVERALAKHRRDMLDLLPLVVMQEASRQLGLLGRTSDGDVLRMLRDRLRLLSGEPEQDDDADFGAYEPGRNVEVRDITLTQFMAVDEAM